MQGEKKWHEGRGVPGQLPVESDTRLQPAQTQGVGRKLLSFRIILIIVANRGNNSVDFSFKCRMLD